MKLRLFFGIAAMTMLCGFAPAAADVTTNPDIYFLRLDQVADSYLLLPPPPADSSARFAADKEAYYQGKALRETPRGDQAAQDARLDSKGVAHAFSEAFGTDISPETTPEIYRLVSNMREDAGDLSTRAAKNYYNRTRPYIYFGEHTCVPDDEAGLSTNGSYPSGHTAIGWAEALVLAEINPARQNEILKRGFEMGQSRVICGYHFQSDVDAGRVVAAAVVARLHAHKPFMRQLAKAKKEMKSLVKKGLVKQ